MNHPTPQQIRQAREKAGLSVIQMAEIMQVTPMTVYNWERGQHKMTPRDFEYMQIKLSSR